MVSKGINYDTRQFVNLYELFYVHILKYNDPVYVLTTDKFLSDNNNVFKYYYWTLVCWFTYLTEFCLLKYYYIVKIPSLKKLSLLPNIGFLRISKFNFEVLE